MGYTGHRVAISGGVIYHHENREGGNEHEPQTITSIFKPSLNGQGKVGELDILGHAS
jgi:hypothetical protein